MRRAAPRIDRRSRARAISRDDAAADARNKIVLPEARAALLALHHPHRLPAMLRPRSARSRPGALKIYQMGLLYPGALIFVALVPLLVLAYLAKERPSRVTVSSVLAFRALRGFRRERFGGWPRFDWMFFAEVLILSLAVLAMAGPFIWEKSNPLALVIANSAAMHAPAPSGTSRFAIA